jgi:hypothetical protein
MNTKLAQLQAAISNATQGMSTDDLTRHPEGKWSSAEILEHLNLTYTGTLKNLDRSLGAGKPLASSDRRSKRLQRFVVTGIGYLPSGRKAPERAQPRGTPAGQVAAEVLQNISRMDEVIGECEARFGNRTAIADHPILGPLTASEWRKFHLVHGKHHARQIMRLKQIR